jgi:hypothetical protein
VNLFVVGGKVFSFKDTKDLLQKLCPNSEIKPTEKKFANQYFGYTLEITDKEGKYGISNDFGGNYA